MNDDNDNVVHKVLEKIQAELSDQGKALRGLDSSMTTLMLAVASLQEGQRELRELVRSTHAEVVRLRLSERISDLEHRIAALEAIKH